MNCACGGCSMTLKTALQAARSCTILYKPDTGFQRHSPFSFLDMESIITLLADQGAWEQLLARRLMRGCYSWHQFEVADAFVGEQKYLPVAERLVQGQGLGIPVKRTINKMGTGKKRVVYTYGPDEMRALSLISYLLYRYDHCFAPNCYAFRQGLHPHDAIRQLNKAIGYCPMWAYKLDIHDYFNSIPIALLLPKLALLLADDQPLFRFFEQMLTDNHVLDNGKVVEEPHGIMAGTPTSPFLANVFLSDVDHHFHDAGVVYARYSDDIILFAQDQETLESHKTTLLRFIEQHGLTVNPDKERVYTPDEPFEFLGFKCHEHEIGISAATIKKMKGKISRHARALLRWRKRKDIGAERAMAAMIRHYNRKFFEDDDPETLTWSRWYFPVINQTEGLKEIDQYLQQQIRFLSTGRHNKANFKVEYETLKRLGYRSLVHEFYRSQK